MPPRPDPQIGLGRAIHRLRTDASLTQETLGNEAGLHPTWISHIESGRINPTWGNMRKVARALGVSLPELAALAEELEPPPK